MKNKKLIIIYISSFFIILLNLYILSNFFYINITKSLPRGIYKISPALDLKKEDIIIFEVPKNSKIYLYERKYVPIIVKSLMKKIATTKSSKIEIINNNLIIDKKNWGKIKKNDSLGRKLPELSLIDLTPLENEILPLAETENSFDGRYFGPININQIKYKAHLYLSF